jgi:hypothetical protein
MEGFHVRTATNEDLPAIAAGFARACGKPREAIEEKVGWALGSNPAGWSGVVAVDARSGIVAHLGASHVPMVIEGEPVVLGRVYASWVDPLLQIAGVHNGFGELDDAFREAFEGSAILATYGMFADSDWWTLRRLRDFAPVRSEIVLERAAAPHRPDPKRAEPVRLGPESLRSFGDGLVLGGCHARRDATTLAFRTGGPYRSDVAWVASRDGRLSGVLVYRDSATERVVLDLAVHADDEGGARALLDLAIGDGSRKVRLPSFSRSPWFLLAQRKGFRVAGFDLPYLVIRPSKARTEGSGLMETWHVGAADVGLRALPQMLAREEVVTAAPSGTVAARERHA